MIDQASSTAKIKTTDFAVFEATPSISALINAVDSNFTVLAITDLYLNEFNNTNEEIAGKGFFEASATSSTYNAATIERLRKLFEDVMASKKRNGFQLEVNKNNTSFYYSITNSPVIDSIGNVSHIIHTITEVAEPKAIGKQTLKEMDKAYHLFMEAPVAVCILKGPDYVFELANEGMLQFLGRTPEIVGKPILEALPEAKIQGLIDILDSVYHTKKPYHVSTFPATLLINGVREQKYFDLIFQIYSTDQNDANSTGIFCVAHNVTDQVISRQKVEDVKDKLNFRNALFEAQNEATFDGVLIVDEKGQVLYSNKRYADIWQMPAEVVESRDDKAALAHAKTVVADADNFIRIVEAAYSDPVRQIDDIVLFKDGRVIERHGTPVIGENKLYYGWAWYFRDVTDRINQEQKFKNVVQQAPDPILILKGEEMVLEVANDALYKIWNIDETAIGKPFLVILPEMKGQGFMELLLNVYHTGETFHGFETPAVFTRSNGRKETVYFNFSYQPYREANGTITGVLVLASNVTEQVLVKQKLVESERTLRNTIVQAPVAMCILRGPDYIFEIANELYYQLAGKTEIDLLNKPLWECIPEARNEVLEELLLQVYTKGEPVVKYGEPVLLQRDGEIKTAYISFVYEPFRESDGSISRIMVVATDVTEQVLARRKLEANEIELQRRVEERTTELENKNNELKRSNANLEQFAYAASHDLKEPIRKIRIFADRLKKELGEKLTEGQDHLFDRMEMAANRMGSLVDDLLAYSHVSNGISYFEEINLNKKVQNVLEDLELEIVEKGAKISIEELPAVFGNRRQLQQLFQNLITNALKYSKHNEPPEIYIRAQTVCGPLKYAGFKDDSNKEYFLVEVKDNGIGFEQGDAERIFSIFTRLHGNKEYKGTGVGLSIVRRVVENHDGYIWAESKPGEGSTFKILLPAKAYNQA